MKALPQTGRHGETVCCAGITRQREWRRQYPVRFRHLRDGSQFQRWQWVSYDWRLPKDDPRRESRRVEEVSISPGKLMPQRERAAFLAPLINGSTKEAEAEGRSLTLIRPREPNLLIKKKKDQQVAAERASYAAAARQGSFFDKELDALEPCPYEFIYEYTDDAGRHAGTCGDWETAATYWRLSREYGENEALGYIQSEFGERYPRAGMAFVMGTHSRRPQWLLIGVIRLDEFSQLSLL